MSRPAVAPPPDWIEVRRSGLGPFVTRVRYRRPDGTEVEWTSRGHRKGRPVDEIGPAAARPPRPKVPRRTWWIATLFAVGSACFALGSFPPYLDAVSARTDALTFFIGSVFFTAAAALSFVEAAAAPDAVRADPRGAGHRFALLRTRSIDWWATIVQLAGTLWFNAMTFRALADNYDSSDVNQFVWRPDVFGSIAFLVASYLAWAEVCDGPGSVRSHDVSWWVVTLNLAGSVAFGVSAVGAFTLPSTGDVTSFRLDNGGTFVGAICFLVGAVLLIPEARRTA
ncbi:MAG: hypothetical protein ACOYOP_14195 [Microthrixaceae bacterium]